MTLTLFWINLFYAICLFTSISAAVLVMWSRVPTGTAGTVGLTLISLVMAGIATDWLDSNLPWIGVKRSLILWAGVLFVIYWLLQKPWRARERRWNRPMHHRHEDPPPTTGPAPFDETPVGHGYQPIKRRSGPVPPPPKNR